MAVCHHVVGSACVGGSRISQTMVLSYMLLHAPMLGTHMSLRNASVRLQHGSCATACCSPFTRTALARVARERTPRPWHVPGDPFVAAPVTPGIIVAHSSSVLRPAHPWLTANCWRTAPSPAKLRGPRSRIHTCSSVRAPASYCVCVGCRCALAVLLYVQSLHMARLARQQG